MKTRHPRLWPAAAGLLVLLLALPTIAHQGEGRQAQRMPGHEYRMPHGMSQHGGHAEEHGKGPDGAMEAGKHRHTMWVAPPPEYAGKRSDRWADLQAIARGAQLYRQYCEVCHGADGRGTGPAAKGLAHPPADLTHHFHRPPHDGDAYLFWRVSEGGAVEPFKSMGSAMPPFKTLLSEEERWDVLAYVHAYFHLGLAQWQATAEAASEHRHDKHD